MAEEHRARNILFRELTNIPHRVYGPAVSCFREALNSDPDFTARTCVHLCMGGSKIRDQQDVSIITLLQAPNSFPEYREAGRCLMLGRDVYDIEPDDICGIDPFRVFRIDAWLRSPLVLYYENNESERCLTQAHGQKRIQARAHALLYELGKNPKALALFQRKYRVAKPTINDVLPLFAVRRATDLIRPSRLCRGIMVDYLRFLEDNPQRFDGVVLHNRAAMKLAYIYYKIAPCDRARAILFEDNPPADSKLAVLKQIANTGDRNEQARLVIEHRIPDRVAASILPADSPVVLVARLAVMTPTEVLNSRKRYEDSGILNIPEVRREFEAKISHATASIASADFRKSAQGTDASVQAAVDTAKERATKQNRILGEVLILADISGSMEKVIQIMPQFVARIIPQCNDRVFVSWFSEGARTVEATGMTYQECQRATRGIRAGGTTRPQAALESAFRIDCNPDKIVFVTDGGERSGDFTRVLKQSGLEPQMAMIRLPGDPNWLTGKLRAEGFLIDVFETDGSDYYVFDQVVNLLAGAPVTSIIERIMQIELPHRVGRCP